MVMPPENSRQQVFLIDGDFQGALPCDGLVSRDAVGVNWSHVLAWDLPGRVLRVTSEVHVIRRRTRSAESPVHHHCVIVRHSGNIVGDEA